MSWLMRRANPHPDWCAGGHACGLGEHRSDPIVVSLPGAGRLILIRVRGNGEREHVEIRASVIFDRNELTAKRQLSDILWAARGLLASSGRARYPPS